ncbi:MAG: M14 family zinc carboxypeptidase [Candidatus Zixiibacteriota bacterium]
MKRSATTIYIFLLMACLTTAATAGETYFKFEINSRMELEKITRIISIDNVQGTTVYAYANDREMEEFKKFDYLIEILPHPGTLIDPIMSADKADIEDWDTYPTYDAYVAMMNQFAIDYPALCTIVNIGSTVEGRSLLFAKISDNVGTEEDEPEVMYTSSMHGDETTGYVLMLRLIDSLLSAYGTDSLVTRLVDSCEIWINPLANPDGTYNGGNNSVSGATRYNANGIDLNRNYPDPQDGPHPDGNAWQTETINFMNIAGAQNFIISQNFHGGTEVVNYPWDTWSARHPDDIWWQNISHIFADSAQYYSPSGYMTGYDDGITNGFDWYEVAGGRQDYMNYWHGCREATAEISDTKLLSASLLPAHWIYLRVSLLDWLENALYGVRGIVTDYSTGLPIYATIKVVGHDMDSSYGWTDPDVGDYHRLLAAGSYDLEFSSPGFIPHTEYNVTITNWNCVRLDVALDPLPNEPVFQFVEHNSSAVNPGDDVSMKITLKNIGGGNAYNTVGELMTSDPYVTINQSSSTYPTILALGGNGISDDNYEFSISPACTLLHVIDFQLEVTADGPMTDTLDFTFLVGDRVVIFTDDFSFDQGWTGLGGGGEWTIGPAMGGFGSDGTGGPDPSIDHSSSTDNYVLGNDLNGGTGGDYNSGLSTTYYVYSPYIDCSHFTGVEFRFYRWLGVESSSYDHANLEIYNGSTWISIFANTSTINESSWQEQYYDVSAYADNNADFQIRFGIGQSDGADQYCGWNIDDIELKGYGTASGDTPDMSYTPSEIYDSLFLDVIHYDSIKTYNNGDALLRVRYSSTDGWINLNDDQHNINAGDSLILPVMVNTAGLTPGNHLGTIDFTSNDPDTPSGTINLNLHIFSPDIATVETSMEETVESGQEKIHPFVIQNNGPGSLTYEISRLMYNGKSNDKTLEPQVMSESIGYRTSDPDKGGGEEPVYDSQDKSSGGPDSWGYNWVDSNDPEGPVFEWIDISSSGTVVPALGDDDVSAPIAIGFGFPFYENSYSSLRVNSNGLIIFGGSSTNRNNIAIPDDSIPNNIISLWWDDLDPRKGGNIYYYNDVANNRFIISLVEIKNYYSTTGTGSLTCQAILYESGKIILQYATMDPGSDYDGLEGAMIGIENSVGDDGLQVVYNAAYMQDNLAIQFTAANWITVAPSSGTIDPYSFVTIDVSLSAIDLPADIYTGQLIISSNDPDTPILYIPVTMNVTDQPMAPSAPILVSPGDHSEDVPLPVTLIWRDDPVADSFHVQISNDPSFGTIKAETKTIDTTANFSILTEGETYYWKVQAGNEVGWGIYSNTRDFVVMVSYICGDADNNTLINILDITYLISYLYKSGPAPINENSADVNNSGNINILDITYIIAYLYKSGPEPICP